MSSTNIEQLLSEKDLAEFKKFFKEKKQSPRDYILFSDFAYICKNAQSIKEASVQALLETYKKELKTKSGLDSESGLMMSESDYYHYIKELAVAHNKALNEKDDKFRESFDNLCTTGDSIPKRRLIEILDEFGLGINYNDFFSNMRKTENVEFDDFCCLFKANPEGEDIFRKTFGKDIMKPIPAEDNKEGEQPAPVRNPNYPFPIIIVQKN